MTALLGGVSGAAVSELHVASDRGVFWVVGGLRQNDTHIDDDAVG